MQRGSWKDCQYENWREERRHYYPCSICVLHMTKVSTTDDNYIFGQADTITKFSREYTTVMWVHEAVKYQASADRELT